MSDLRDTVAVVVHYRNYDLIGGTVRGLVAQGIAPSNVFIANTSEQPAMEGRLEASLPRESTVLHLPNGGYGNAVNRTLDHLANVRNGLEARFVLVTTHEVAPEPGTIAALRRALLTDSTASAAGPTVVAGSPDDQFVWSKGGRLSRFLQLPVHEGHRASVESSLIESLPQERAWLDGCFVMYRSPDLIARRFDESFFMYMEETDLHLRFRQDGKRVIWVPQAKVWQSSNGVPAYRLTRNLRLLYARRRKPILGLLAVGYASSRRVLSVVKHRSDLTQVPDLFRGLVTKLPDASGSNTPPFPLVIVNPLNGALHHYSEQLQHVLESSGHSVILEAVDEPSKSGRGRISWVLKYCSLLSKARKEHGRSAYIIITWPVLGYLDIVLVKLLHGSRATVIVHDPEPLVRALGYDRFARLIARLFSREIEILVHSQKALMAVLKRPVSARKPSLILHPMFKPHPKMLPKTTVVRVLGQFKPDRDLDALRSIAQNLGTKYELEIWGRGWPSLQGWVVQEGFVTEAKMSELLESSSVVLIPYRRFFQSGIAIQCFEHGTPVVGPRESSLADLYSLGSRLLVDPEKDAGPRSAWAEAVDSALTGRVEVEEAGRRLYASTLESWSAWAAGVDRRAEGRGHE